jgi:DNA-directed RNA polymerase subunit K/omega
MSDIDENDDDESQTNSSNGATEDGDEEDDVLLDDVSISEEFLDDDDDDDEEGEDDIQSLIDDDNDEGAAAAATTMTLDDDNENGDEENYLAKFERDVNKNYVNEFHPECISHNFEEVLGMCSITRDEDCIINDDLHKTIPFLTKYERARVLGQRAKEIEFGALPLIHIESTIIEAHIIAEKELEARKIPFIIKRPIPGGGFEYWKLKDLELIAF